MRLNEMEIKYLQEEVWARDAVIERARGTLRENMIRFDTEEYDPESVYEMFENAETSFPLLKISMIPKMLKRKTPATME